MRRKIKLYKKRFSVVLQDKNKKGFFQIMKEAFIFWIVKREFPYFYFGKFLYRKEIKNYKDYLSSKEIDKVTLSKNLHNPQYATLLRNKLAFAIYMEKSNMSVPPLTGYNLGNRFFYQSKVQMILDKDGLYNFFKDTFEQIGKTRVFVKAITEMGGVGAYLITKENLKEEIEACGDYILANSCIHQEVVIQHEEINKIYKHSVNTIRFDTYLDKNDNIHILSGYMRFGRGGSVVDNSYSGGFYVAIDLDEGVLKGKSFQMMKYGGVQLDRHPDTGVPFEGYKIPYFKEAVELTKKAVNHIPDRIIGWDIAISVDGPVIIEGNDNTSILGPDLILGGFLSHPISKEIMDEA